MTQMTEEWAGFWYQCLSENVDYSRYCAACERNDHDTRSRIELRIAGIAGLHADFGPLDGWPEGGLESARWRTWFVPRRHLFMPDVRALATPSDHQQRVGDVLLVIPLLADQAATRSAVDRYLAHLYGQPQVILAQSPKYRLHETEGRIAHGYEKVRQAVITSTRSYAYHPETFEALTIREATIEFLRNEIDNLGWTLDPAAKRDLLRSGHLSEDRYETFKVRINRCRKDFKAFARNAVRGVFPDDSPFESEVMDQFKGEQSDA
jgi:hypothetical protein